ncbi:MAG: amidophosphoribosyltransferase [Flavobacteriaceae bacterium]|nr:amidophosphoribosyltransferase [Flavobacteriaceae bacterium]
MSDFIKHECGIALVRLLKPLSFYKEKYGSYFYGIDKMYLLMEKQHNRGQDGAGIASIKIGVQPGTRYIDRVRSNAQHSIQDLFEQVYQQINTEMVEIASDDETTLHNKIPFMGNLFLGHVRYGTFGSNSIENVHPFIKESNWMHKNLIVAGNFNLTNTKQLFNELVEIGQHPKEMTDTVTVMEKIGHYLDDEVSEIYQRLKTEGVSKKDSSPIIEKELNIQKILQRSAKNWDGGYAMAGLLGHGDAFVLRDPAGIRPAFYYHDDEVVVVASERPVIQTVFNVKTEAVKELEHGSALIIKKDGKITVENVLEQLPKKSCSFERIYFSRGSDESIYQERKLLGKYVFPQILENIHYDIENTVFSFIPNTAEISFYGIIAAADEYLNKSKIEAIFKQGRKIKEEKLQEILSVRPRIEKIAIKDAKLRTFISSDSTRDDLVAHVYDVTYGVVKPTDNLVIIDDSIVRGTTLKKSILKILDRLNPKKIIIVSSAPQIRYPDCYGIDMAKLGDFIAFRAALELLKDQHKLALLDEVYALCKQQPLNDFSITENYVKMIYDSFSAVDISKKIAEMLKTNNIKSEIEIIFQKVEDLHLACPHHLGDWYFTGDYPTPGGNRVVNEAFINFYEGKNQRAY